MIKEIPWLLLGFVLSLAVAYGLSAWAAGAAIPEESIVEVDRESSRFWPLAGGFVFFSYLIYFVKEGIHRFRRPLGNRIFLAINFLFLIAVVAFLVEINRALDYTSSGSVVAGLPIDVIPSRRGMEVRMWLQQLMNGMYFLFIPAALTFIWVGMRVWRSGKGQ